MQLFHQEVNATKKSILILFGSKSLLSLLKMIHYFSSLIKIKFNSFNKREFFLVIKLFVVNTVSNRLIIGKKIIFSFKLTKKCEKF